jgi:hypothetical protein
MSETEHESGELDEAALPEEELAGDELADDEQAEQAEAEEPAEAEPEAEEQSSFALVQALDKEATRHEKALAKVLGVSVDELHSCPTCEGVGYTPEPIEGEADLEQDPYLTRCERCAGYGEVRTGARAPGLVTVPCPGCTGQGYVQLPEQPEAQPELGNGAPAYAPPAPSAQVAPGDRDAVADLRARGYTIVEPIVVPAESPA